MAKPRIILNADDLGLSLDLNEGVRQAAKNGCLTSACIRVNGAAYREAVTSVVPDIPHIGIGLHLNIVEGKSTRRNIGGNEILCESDGSYRLRFLGLRANCGDKRLMAEIRDDFRDQIEIALADLGSIDHLNSHQHSHGISEIFEIVCQLAAEYEIPYVRLPRERFYLAPPYLLNLRSWFILNNFKWIVLNRTAKRNSAIARQYDIRVPDWFVGILYTGHMNVASVIDGIRKAADQGGVIEVLLHPAKTVAGPDDRFLSEQVRKFVCNPYRQQELDSLLSPELKTSIETEDWELSSFSDLVAGSSPEGF